MKRISYSLFLVTLMMVFGQQAYSQQFEVINNQTAIKAKLNNLDVIFEGKFTNNYGAYKINIKRILLKKGDQILQELKGLNLRTTRIHPADYIVDFNQDGFQDLKLRVQHTSSRSGMYECFIFNPQKQALEYNALLSKQVGLRVDGQFVVSTEMTLYTHCQYSSYTKYFKYDATNRRFYLVKTKYYRSNSNPNNPGRHLKEPKLVKEKD